MQDGSKCSVGHAESVKKKKKVLAPLFHYALINGSGFL